MTNPRNKLVVALIIVLLVSISFNIILFNNYKEIKADQEATDDSIIFFGVRAKLFQYTDTYHYIAKFLSNPKKTPEQSEKFKNFMDGTIYFLMNETNSDIATAVAYKDDDRLKTVFDELRCAILTMKSISKNLAEMTDLEIEELAKVYGNLFELLNENNQEDSFTYNLVHNKLDDPNLDRIINEIHSNTNYILTEYPFINPPR